MRSRLVIFAAACLSAGAASAVEVTIVSFEDGDLNFSLKGSGTVSVYAQVDFKYISAKTDTESLGRATSAPMTVKLTGEETPVTIKVAPPDGALVEVEVVIFVDGAEKARQTYYY